MEQKMEQSINKALDNMPNEEKAKFMIAYLENPEAVAKIIFSMMQKAAK